MRTIVLLCLALVLLPSYVSALSQSDIVSDMRKRCADGRERVVLYRNAVDDAIDLSKRPQSRTVVWFPGELRRVCAQGGSVTMVHCHTTTAPEVLFPSAGMNGRGDIESALRAVSQCTLAAKLNNKRASLLSLLVDVHSGTVVEYGPKRSLVRTMQREVRRAHARQQTLAHSFAYLRHPPVMMLPSLTRRADETTVVDLLDSRLRSRIVANGVQFRRAYERYVEKVCADDGKVTTCPLLDIDSFASYIDELQLPVYVQRRASKYVPP